MSYHHFNPRLMLRNFAFDTSKKFVYVYDKKKNIIHKPNNIANILGKDNFYNKNTEILFDLKIERPFSKTYLNELSKFDILQTSKDINTLWESLNLEQVADFTSTLLVRNPYFLNNSKILHFKESVSNIIKDKDFNDYLIADFNTSLRLKMAEYNTEIVIGINRTEIPFITSDFPVYFTDINNIHLLLSDNNFNFNFLYSEKSEIFFAISPTTMIFFKFNSGLEPSVKYLNVLEVIHLNNMIFKQSKEKVIFNNLNSLYLFLERINIFPKSNIIIM